MQTKIFKKLFLLAALSFFSISFSVAQIKVSGTVKGDDGESVIGASVTVKGNSGLGARTDLNGHYSITVPGEKNILVFTYVGMAMQEVTVGKQTTINVTLKEDAKVLSEVVVVGYGTMKKSDLTGAVSSYRPDEQEAGKVSSIDQMLQGKVAGLSIASAVEAPGSASSVTIRGANSLRGDNQPLYVIDNIPQASAGQFISSGSDGTFSIATNPLSSLNPADIESIEVLKDASATAIYGSRGANGVILVTTKRGKSGKATVSASANFTVANAYKLLNMMNIKQVATYNMIRGGGYQKDKDGKWNLWKEDPKTHEMVWNDLFSFYIDGNDVYRKNAEVLGMPDKWSVLTPVNWQREVYSSALSQNYSVTLSGGNDKTTYFSSASFKNIEGLVKKTGLVQGDFRINLNTNISKTVKVALAVNGSIKKNNMMSGGNTTGGATGAISNVALYSAPYVRSKEEMEQTTPNLADRATVWTWVDDYDDITNQKSFRASMDLTWNIFKFLSYNLRTGGNVTLENRDRWFNITLYTGALQNGYITQATLNKNNYTVENLLQFNHSIDKIVDINATGAVTYDAYKSLNTLLVGNNFKIYDFRSKGMHIAGQTEYKQPIQSDFQLLSFLGRANLNFLEGRYLLTASIRADATSKFISAYRWDYFPAATIAWRAEQEKFLQNVKWLNQLKFRLGYGETGSQSIEPYSSFSNYGTQFTNTPQGSDKPAQGATADGQKLIGLVVNKMSNSGLRWERTKAYNFGIDFSVFKNRFGGSIDIYTKTTSNLLIQRDLPSSTGYSKIVVNQGSLNNKGVEIALRSDIIRQKDITWSLSGNIAFNDPRILDFGLPEKQWGTETWKAYLGNSLGDHFGEANIFVVGKAPGLFYGYRTDGVIQAEDTYLTDIKKSIGTLSAGNLKLVDTNGDHEINENDRVIIGNPNPKFNYGFQTNVTWKNVSLAASFNGVYGNNILNANARYFALPSNSSGMLYASSFAKIWRNDNPWIGEYHGNEMPSANSVTPKVILDRYIEDGSYLRCSDITLSYNFPKNLLQKTGFASIGVFASVKNAFTISNYSGYDPEVNSFAFDGTRPGIDMSSYPRTRSLIFGINVSL